MSDSRLPEYGCADCHPSSGRGKRHSPLGHCVWVKTTSSYSLPIPTNTFKARILRPTCTTKSPPFSLFRVSWMVTPAPAQRATPTLPSSPSTRPVSTPTPPTTTRSPSA
ncbi:hypothetical protein VTK26DRAFT_6696 [Humicola hyalothermophila]